MRTSLEPLAIAPRKLAYAKLPGLIRQSLRLFRRLTGFTAVPALRPVSADGPGRAVPLPPIHPRCARMLRKIHRQPPCPAEWREHLRFGQKTLGCKRHICPLGLRCACIPILLGDELLGFAKFVSGPEISDERFGLAADQLELLMARPCQDLHVALLQEEIRALRFSVSRLARAKRPVALAGSDGHAAGCGDETRPATAPSPTLISQVLDYLNDHFTDPVLSLTEVAAAVGKNGKYLAHAFAQGVGERMHAYITALRVRRACELLLATTLRVQQVARDSGFTNTAQFRQLFHRHVGVTATEYRQIFASEAGTFRDMKRV